MDSFVLILSLVSSARAEPQKLPAKTMQVCGRKLSVEIARSSEERAKGLMDREGLPAGKGMVFVFEQPQALTFWMKNVPFDIDIGFFDAKGKLQKSMTMSGTSPLMRDDSLPRYEGPAGSLYALEAPAAFFRKSDAKNCRMSPLP